MLGYALLELEKAYERVDWDFFEMARIRVDIPKSVVASIKEFYDGLEASILPKNGLAATFCIHRGLGQGDLLS